jgi:hypothetical protein
LPRYARPNGEAEQEGEDVRTHRSVAAAGVAAGLLALGLTPAQAHHAFSAEYDNTKPIKLEGTVRKVEWINPHSWITIDVKAADGTMETWEVEAGSPNSMFRRGFNRNSLPTGITVVVNGYQARDGGRRANGGNITFSDGRRLFLGGSNPDDPENRRR